MLHCAACSLPNGRLGYVFAVICRHQNCFWTKAFHRLVVAQLNFQNHEATSMIRMAISIPRFYPPEFLTVYFVIYQSKYPSFKGWHVAIFRPFKHRRRFGSSCKRCKINPFKEWLIFCSHECHHQFGLRQKVNQRKLTANSAQLFRSISIAFAPENSSQRKNKI